MRPYNIGELTSMQIFNISVVALFLSLKMICLIFNSVKIALFFGFSFRGSVFGILLGKLSIFAGTENSFGGKDSFLQ